MSVLIFGIMFTLIPIIPVVLYYLYWKREQKINLAKTFLSEIVLEDQIWQIEDLKNTARSIYTKYQESWEKRDLTDLKDVMESPFFDKIQKELESQNLKQIIHYRENISIKILEIVGVEDYKNNLKDSFKAYFEVYLFTYSSFYGEINHLTEKNRREEEIYSFTRNGNSWLLNNIENTYHSDELSKVRLFKE